MLFYNLKHWNDPNWFSHKATNKNKIKATVNDCMFVVFYLFGLLLYFLILFLLLSFGK